MSRNNLRVPMSINFQRYDTNETFLYAMTYLDLLRIVLPFGHFDVLRRIGMILGRWFHYSRRGLLIARWPVKLSILGRINVWIIPMAAVIRQLALREIRLRPVQLTVIRRVRQCFLLLLVTLSAVLCGLRLLLTTSVGLVVRFRPFVGTLLAHLGLLPLLLTGWWSVNLVERQLFLQLLMRLVMLSWILCFRRRIYLVKCKLARILRLGAYLLVQMMLPFRLRVTA